jgi:SNF2 family DNA or RNA helicase
MTFSGLRDNYLRTSVGDFLKKEIKSDAELSIVSAYFTIYAYQALKENFDPIRNLRFLFGEPTFIKQLDFNKNEQRSFGISHNEITTLNQLTQKQAAKDCAEWLKSKAEIKSVIKSNFLHAKMFHINNHTDQKAILGSANFTSSGLGLCQNNNIELDLIANDDRDRADLMEWFNQIWNDETLVKDVKEDVLKYLNLLYKDTDPELVYYLTLYHLFKDRLTDEEKKQDDLTQKMIFETDVWNTLYDFQKDGVKGAIRKINQYNGCILADSVGLGKTFEALAVIKYFEIRNMKKVLVLCPKKLRENWTLYIQNTLDNPFLNDQFNYDVLSHTDLSRENGTVADIDLAKVYWGNYDLVVIDESHNFRNNTPGKLDKDGKPVLSRSEKLLQKIIKEGIKTRVLMLSATPVNNTLMDLRNQIRYISAGEDTAYKDTLGIANISTTLVNAQRRFNEWTKQKNSHSTKDLLERLDADLFKLLDALTIARSRKHIKRFYKLNWEGSEGFPKRGKKPISLYSEIDSKKEFWSYDDLNDKIDKYNLSVYNPSKYLLQKPLPIISESGKKEFKQEDRERFLIGMMKVNFLKRLESSIASFTSTMGRTLDAIQHTLDKIKGFEEKKILWKDMTWEDLELQAEEDEELADLLTIGKLEIPLNKLDLPKWKVNLEKDRDMIREMYEAAQKVTPDRDAKLSTIKEIIQKKVMTPTHNKDGKPNRKILVFTAFADTANYLYDQLKDWAQTELGIHLAVVTGGNSRTTLGNGKFNEILTLFSPVSKNRKLVNYLPQDQEIDLLIGTDCISEGQNLQDCDLVINYDIHWNPVRVIQRFGRIDRLGSICSTISLVNFWPTNDLDKYISLKERVEARMALVDLSATADDNLLNPEMLEDLITDDLKYRSKQLKKLQEEILDMDDFNEDSIDLTDFSLDDFRMDLQRYLEKYKQKLEESPEGLMALAPVKNGEYSARKGVLFCLRQRVVSRENNALNPTQPYYLVYILENGDILYNYGNARKTLEVMRGVSSGLDNALPDLCDMFNMETGQGKNMEAYNQLLKNTLRGISKRYSDSLATGLGTKWDFKLPTKTGQLTPETEMDLVTWMVIK